MSGTNWQLRLYPRAWRDRYERELSAILEARPSTLGDRIDLVRGAFDAHLHPRLVTGEPDPPWTHRIPGLIAFAAGATWTAAAALFLVWPDPSADWSGAVVGSALAMFVSLPGEYMTAHGRRIAAVIGLVVGSVLAANLVAWPARSLPMVAAMLLILGGMLALGGIRAGVGSAGRRWMVAVAVGLPAVLAAPVVSGLVGDGATRWLGLAILGPYGLAWTLVGLRLLIHGSATFPDEPIPTEREVSPA